MVRRVPKPEDQNTTWFLVSQLAAQLAVMRLAHGWSQRVLARKIGTAQSEISELETGKRANIELLTLVAWANALSADVEIHIKQRTETPDGKDQSH